MLALCLDMQGFAQPWKLGGTKVQQNKSNLLGTTADSHPSRQRIRFITGGAEHMTLDTTGFLGIGVPVPQYALDVSGRMRSSLLGGSAGLALHDTAGALLSLPFTGDPAQVLLGNGNWGSYADNDWQLSGPDMYAIPAGNVGLGTPSPQYKLDVTGDVRATGSIYAGQQVVSGQITGGKLVTDSINAGMLQTGSMHADSALRVANSIIIDGVQDRITSTSGHIDFGNTALHSSASLDVADLHVSGQSSFGTLVVNDSLRIGTSSLWISQNDNTIYTTGGNLNIQNQLNSPNTVMNLHSGKVGIGVANPKKKLHVKTVDYSQSGGGNSGSIRIEHHMPNQGLNSTWDLEPYASQNQIAFTIGTPDNPVIRLVDNGNVGIGASEPQAQLDVQQPAFDKTAVRIWKNTAPINNDNWDILTVGKTLMNSNPKVVFVVKDTGNVGIGTANPQARLDVNGGAAFQGNHVYIRNQNAPFAKQTWGFVISTSTGQFNLGQTTDNLPIGGSLSTVPFIVKPGASSNSIVITANGVGIGTPSPNKTLTVAGIIGACEVIVDENQWCDYVFDKNYMRMTFEERRMFYTQYKRLPMLDTEEEIQKNGLGVAGTLKGITFNLEEFALNQLELYEM
ncbi:MAG: hypothetical protein ACE5DN_02265, partial [Flavobacteriales bacterium]